MVGSYELRYWKLLVTIDPANTDFHGVKYDGSTITQFRVIHKSGFETMDLLDYAGTNERTYLMADSELENSFPKAPFVFELRDVILDVDGTLVTFQSPEYDAYYVPNKQAIQWAEGGDPSLVTVGTGSWMVPRFSKRIPGTTGGEYFDVKYKLVNGVLQWNLDPQLAFIKGAAGDVSANVTSFTFEAIETISGNWLEMKHEIFTVGTKKTFVIAWDKLVAKPPAAVNYRISINIHTDDGTHSTFSVQFSDLATIVNPPMPYLEEWNILPQGDSGVINNFPLVQNGTTAVASSEYPSIAQGASHKAYMAFDFSGGTSWRSDPLYGVTDGVYTGFQSTDGKVGEWVDYHLPVPGIVASTKMTCNQAGSPKQFWIYGRREKDDEWVQIGNNTVSDWNNTITTPSAVALVKCKCIRICVSSTNGASEGTCNIVEVTFERQGNDSIALEVVPVLKGNEILSLHAVCVGTSEFSTNSTGQTWTDTFNHVSYTVLDATLQRLYLEDLRFTMDTGTAVRPGTFDNSLVPAIHNDTAQMELFPVSDQGNVIGFGAFYLSTKTYPESIAPNEVTWDAIPNPTYSATTSLCNLPGLDTNIIVWLIQILNQSDDSPLYTYAQYDFDMNGVIEDGSVSRSVTVPPGGYDIETLMDEVSFQITSQYGIDVTQDPTTGGSWLNAGGYVTFDTTVPMRLFANDPVNGAHNPMSYVLGIQKDTQNYVSIYTADGFPDLSPIDAFYIRSSTICQNCCLLQGDDTSKPCFAIAPMRKSGDYLYWEESFKDQFCVNYQQPTCLSKIKIRICDQVGHTLHEIQNDVNLVFECVYEA